jgi:hypothetical protein
MDGAFSLYVTDHNLHTLLAEREQERKVWEYNLKQEDNIKKKVKLSP